MNKPQDTKAAEIRYGVELETFIPLTCGVDVGGYHAGRSVPQGMPIERQGVTGAEAIEAPRFRGQFWRADNDGSIRPDQGFKSAEFVSPRLYGEAGLAALDQFVGFASRIGGKVNGSCGCHVTVSIPSVIGSSEPRNIADFIRKLVRVADFHAWAIYAQTGTGRHENTYCRKPQPTAGAVTNDFAQAEKYGDQTKRVQVLSACGRGMVNLNKAFPMDLSESAVEFRAFAGTLNRFKVLHHVATCLGIMRKAHEARHIPHYGSTKKPTDAQDAMFRMWRHLNWLEDESCGETPFGLFGLAHEFFNQHTAIALKMAAKFEQRYPKASL